MKIEFIKFFNLQRQIFGVCPHCRDFFRLSDCRILLRKKPALDWLAEMVQGNDHLDRAEDRLDEIEKELAGWPPRRAAKTQ